MVEVGDERWDGGASRLCVVVWVGNVCRQRRRSGTAAAQRSNSGGTSFEVSEVGWGISEYVFWNNIFAESPIPQRLYGSVYKLRNKWFRNSFEHLPMCCGITHSATCIWICKEVAEWVVPQYIGSVLRNHPFRN